MSLVYVSSSDLRAVAYDDWSRTLVIEFNSGGGSLRPSALHLKRGEETNPAKFHP